MSEPAVLYDVKDRVATLTLNRPDKLNAYNEDMRQAFVAGLDKANADDDVRAIVVTGAGRAFCAGADLSSGGDTFDPKNDRFQTADTNRIDLASAVFQSLKPVIGAMNGHAVGIGVTMCLPMDARIGSVDAKLGLVFTRRGLVPELAASWFLPRLVGVPMALDWLLSGRMISAQEAHDGGLLQEILPADQVLPRALEKAREIAENTSAVSVAMTRQMVWRFLGEPDFRKALAVDTPAIRQMGSTPDVYESVQAFLDKRAPNFKSKVSTDMPPVYPWWED